MKILFLITDLGKGGAERFLADLCSELQKRENIEFIIAALYNNNQFTDITSKFTIVQLNYSEYKLFGKNEYPQYKKLLDTFNPQIIHTHRFLGEFISAFYLRKNIKYICHGHDNMIQFENISLNTFLNKKKLLNYYEKLYLIKKKYKNVNTSFISNSAHTFGFYKKVLPSFMKRDIFQINYGFNYDRFYNGKKNYDGERKTFRIINIGSFQDKKNQIFIVDIASELKKNKIPFEIHLLGDGVNREKVQESIVLKGLTNEIQFHGNVNNVEQWLWKSDIYLHTAYYEPFGLVFLEAMAAGLPCIALDGKGNRDLFEDGKNGYIIYEQITKKFTDKILELYYNPILYREISTYAQEFAKKYDIKEIASKYIEFYNQILYARNDTVGQQ